MTATQSTSWAKKVASQMRARAAQQKGGKKRQSDVPMPTPHVNFLSMNPDPPPLPPPSSPPALPPPPPPTTPPHMLLELPPPLSPIETTLDMLAQVVADSSGSPHLWTAEAREIVEKEKKKKKEEEEEAAAFVALLENDDKPLLPFEQQPVKASVPPPPPPTTIEPPPPKDDDDDDELEQIYAALRHDLSKLKRALRRRHYL
jgi:hypothetical protein